MIAGLTEPTLGCAAALLKGIWSDEWAVPYLNEGIGRRSGTMLPIPEGGADDDLANQFGYTSTLIS
jgi:hypothetical protein